MCVCVLHPFLISYVTLGKFSTSDSVSSSLKWSIRTKPASCYYHKDKREGQGSRPKITAKQQNKINETHKSVAAQYQQYAKTKADDETKKAIKKLVSSSIDKGR